METGSEAEIKFVDTVTGSNNIPTSNVPDDAKEAEVQPLPTIIDIDSLVEAFLSSEEPEEPLLPVKKKRGRPKKSEQLPKLPTRGSTRLRKCSTRVNYDERDNRPRRFWRRREKRQLLRGLIEFGTDNLPQLQEKFLPDRTVTELKNQINMWKEFAKVDVMKKLLTEKRRQESATVNCVSKLDEWLHHMEQTETDGPQLFALSNVFLLIAEYAKLPTPQECDGLDFRAMYRWLHSMLNSSPYFGLNQATASVLNDSISHLFMYLRERQELNRLQPQLFGLAPETRTRCRTYSRPAKSSSKPVRINSLLNLPGMNPLHIPPHLLHKPLHQELVDNEELPQELLDNEQLQQELLDNKELLQHLNTNV